jgi:hypothetical protein
VAEIDDAAILKRAKALCEEASVAWDGLSATAPGTRVLNDRDRRECLMRARRELMRDGETAEKPKARTARAPWSALLARLRKFLMQKI